MDTRLFYHVGTPLNTEDLFKKQEKLKKSQMWKKANQKHPAFKK